MENINNVGEIESSPTGIFELPGETAVVINGLPPSYPRDGDRVACYVAHDEESHQNTGFGEWLVGRNVKKLFGKQFYSGKITEFDEEMGWYRVVYEDGDVEDLEWPELEKVLEPLDIKVPLDSIATKIIKKRLQFRHKSTKAGAQTRDQSTSSVDRRGKSTEVLEENIQKDVQQVKK